MGEVLCQSIDEGLIALMEGKTTSRDDDAVEGFVHPFPWQVQQSQLAKGLVHRLPWSQSAQIVQSRIVVQSASAEALHTAPWLMRAFQHKCPKTFLCKQCSALKAAQSTSDNQDIIVHSL